jgi:hypothetical protein
MLRAPRYFFWSPTARRWFETDGASFVQLHRRIEKSPGELEGFLFATIDLDNILGLVVDAIVRDMRDESLDA